MKTPKEILEKHCGKVATIYRHDAIKAMKEYAELYHEEKMKESREPDLKDELIELLEYLQDYNIINLEDTAKETVLWYLKSRQ